MGSASSPQTQVPMKPGRKYLINPGSVGQPRDGDPRAAYAIVDTSLRVVELYRTRYAIEDAQTKVVKAGLPDVLAQRLAVGR
jgi:diadenosine tetraphosphatase ApaH/serine/threonine PP2A family protein phosphatase